MYLYGRSRAGCRIFYGRGVPCGHWSQLPYGGGGGGVMRGCVRLERVMCTAFTTAQCALGPSSTEYTLIRQWLGQSRTVKENFHFPVGLDPQTLPLYTYADHTYFFLAIDPYEEAPTSVSIDSPGIYHWFPSPLPRDGCLVQFKVRGSRDLVITFAPDQDNGNIYEVGKFKP